MQRITPFLWFNDNAEQAVNFYTSVFRNSSIGHIARHGDKVMVVAFTLDGQAVTAMNGGPMFKFNEAISLVVSCKDQEEVDYFWERLTADGGQESQCGWLKDKYGLSWQVVPQQIGQIMAGPDQVKSSKAMQAMMGMKKLDIAALEKAYAEG